MERYVGVKLTTELLKKLIKEELQKVNEMQVELGLSHKFTNQELYEFVKSFIMKNPTLRHDTTKHYEADQILKILANAIRNAVRHKEDRLDGDEYIPGTTPEDTETMREEQGKLKMIEAALLQAMGRSTGKSWRRGRSEDFRDAAAKFKDLPEDEKPWWARKG